MTVAPSPRARAEDIGQTVGQIVGTVLERHVDSSVDVFDLGATSLAFIRIVAEINERYDIKLDVAELEDDEASIDTLSRLVVKLLKSQESATVRS